MRSAPRFTVRGLMALTAVTACCLGLSVAIGLVLGTFLVALLICYLLASVLSVRARALAAAFCLVLTMFSCFDEGAGSFVLTSFDHRLPTIALPGILHGPGRGIYFLSECPLDLVAAIGPPYSDVIYLDFAPFMSHLALRYFWLGFATAFGVSIGTSLGTDWQWRRSQHRVHGSNDAGNQRDNPSDPSREIV
jgi:hypothetical protein